MAAPSPPLAAAAGEKKHWWLTNKKMVEKYVREARSLLATQDHGDVAAALRLLEAALALSPRMEAALELKARSLLHLRRFAEVADMLQDYIPSLKMAVTSDDTSSSSSGSFSDTSSNRLLSAGGSEPAFKCFSVSDLKRKVVSGLFPNGDREGQWRYSVLGQACCHLGLMEDAMVLLQTGKRLAAAASRRESVHLSDDAFSLNKPSPETTPPPPPNAASHHLLSHVKLLLRRRAAASAALDAGLHSEAIRHFSKILDGRRGAPYPFLAGCYVRRAAAYCSAGRLADAFADCNRALALDSSSTEALSARADLFESIRCLPDSLHDLEHLKLLYNTILRDRKLPGPAWRPPAVHYREIPGRLCSLAAKIQQLKQRVAAGEKSSDVDYHALIGIKRGCTKSELERAHLLLTLKHKPEKSSAFIDKCEFVDEKDVDEIRDRAKMSALVLYRLLQKGYRCVMAAVLEEEVAEKQRKKSGNSNAVATPPASVFQGAFCRELAAVGNLLSQAGYNCPIIPVKYEGLSC
ncbi:Heat shock protein DnaJ with tetratricopeptide repeat [Striga hermonthica]|uniref:Heat shock protein DnaJ with tetratricopeptide repeat n=1 Tax=Striga hermonthica TaxID=68872 RepID=A0A9N7P2A8_STRHE|nr:Heat shock protein DnaJ with tetratricopeptide repeat [Striga hermonthica]